MPPREGIWRNVSAYFTTIRGPGFFLVTLYKARNQRSVSYGGLEKGLVTYENLVDSVCMTCVLFPCIWIKHIFKVLVTVHTNFKRSCHHVFWGQISVFSFFLLFLRTYLFAKQLLKLFCLHLACARVSTIWCTWSISLDKHWIQLKFIRLFFHRTNKI